MLQQAEAGDALHRACSASLCSKSENHDMTKATGMDAGGFRNKAKVPAADFCYQMEWKGSLVNDPTFFTWSHFGLQGPDGRFHLFGERVASETIRTNQAHIAWALCKCAEIAHYTADQPEGPYRFADIPLQRGKAGEFDPSMIYPTVHQDGKRWVMMYNGIETIGDGHCSLHGVAAVGDGALHMAPVEELKTLRQERKTKRNIVVPTGRDIELKKFGKELLELEVVLAPGAATQCGVKVCCSDDGREETSLYYEATEHKLVCDTTRSGLGFGRKTVEGGPFALAHGELLTLRVFVDRSIVEVYANDRQAVARAIYPTLGGRGVKLFAHGSEVNAASVSAWELMPSNPS